MAIGEKTAKEGANVTAIEIANHFKYYFKTVLAIDESIKNQVYGIRHRVYCEELEYEATRSTKIEQDEFDVQSYFAAVQHKASKEFAGCVRVVEVNDDELLPVEKYCSSVLNHPNIHPSKFDRDTICEISRIAVLDTFRRRKTDNYKGAAIGAINGVTFSETEQRCFPFIAISLYMAACAMAHILGKKHAFIMAEPRLIRCMSLVGINFEQVGDIMEFHGSRAPFYLSYEKFITELKPAYIKMYFDIEKKVLNQFKTTNANPDCFVSN